MSLTRSQRVLINFIAFQCAWFATVLGAARNQLALESLTDSGRKLRYVLR